MNKAQFLARRAILDFERRRGITRVAPGAAEGSRADNAVAIRSISRGTWRVPNGRRELRTRR